MRFMIDQHHVDFFSKEHYVELEELFSSSECETLKAQADTALQKRAKPANPTSNRDLYLLGRNLWKEGVDTKKFCQKKHIGEMASRLFKKKPLRLAFDQYINTAYTDLPFATPLSLQKISCLRPLLGGLIVFLSDPPSLSLEEGILPQKAGNALFVSPHLALPLPFLFSQAGVSLLVWAFSAEATLYCLEKNDPYTHSLKKDGLVFGDRVKEEHSPTIFR